MVSRRHPRLLAFFVSAGLLLSSTLASAQGTGGSEPPSGGAGGGGAASSPEPLLPSDTSAQGTTPTVDPSKDQQRLNQQGRDRPTQDGTIGSRPSEVYSEDWWAHTRPIFEIHGYFRTRGELFHNFALGR